MTGLDDVYRQRFPEVSRRQKDMIWPEIARYLEQWVDPTAPVLDIACDSGYFIRNVHAVERWAADLRDVRAELPDDVHFVQANGLDLDLITPGLTDAARARRLLDAQGIGSRVKRSPATPHFRNDQA